MERTNYLKDFKHPVEILDALNSEIEENLNSFTNFLANTQIDHNKNPHTTKLISQHLHRLKGSLGFLDFKTLCKMAKDCEQSLKDSDSKFPIKLDAFCAELRKLSTEIKEFQNKRADDA